jgi:hypothetical protein
MFTSDERRSDIPFLSHLKLHVDVIPGSVGVWANFDVLSRLGHVRRRRATRAEI